MACAKTLAKNTSRNLTLNVVVHRLMAPRTISPVYTSEYNFSYKQVQAKLVHPYPRNKIISLSEETGNTEDMSQWPWSGKFLVGPFLLLPIVTDFICVLNVFFFWFFWCMLTRLNIKIQFLLTQHSPLQQMSTHITQTMFTYKQKKHHQDQTDLSQSNPMSTPQVAKESNYTT